MRLICASLPLAAAASLLHAQEKAAEGAREFAADPAPASRAARDVPADVNMFLHIEDAAGIRRELAQRPVAAWLHSAITNGEAGRVWSEVAGQAAIEPGALFDALLGRRMTFVLRSAAEDRDHLEWALLTRIDSQIAEKMLAALKPIALGPKSRMAMLELPEHQLVLARRDDHLLIGPKNHKRLFEQMLDRTSDVRPVDDHHLGQVLSRTDALRLHRKTAHFPREDRRPRMTLYLKHDQPLGGHSLAVAEFGRAEDHVSISQKAVDAWRVNGLAPHVVIRHYGSFDVSPFSRGMSRSQIDCSVLKQFDAATALVMVEPVDGGRGQLELFLEVMAGKPLLSPPIRAALGERRLFVLGAGLAEADRNAEPALPALAVCFETAKGEADAKELDRHMQSLSKHLRARFKSDQLEHMSLQWSVAGGAHGQWYVIASHPDHMDEVVSALSRPSFAHPAEEDAQPLGSAVQVAPARDVTGLHSAGAMGGPAFAAMLQQLRGHAELLSSDHREQANLRELMHMLSELAAGLDRATWQLRRPSETEVDLEVELHLAR